MIGANIPAPPAAAGVSGSTGSVDNAILRADGTGGSTIQSSAISISDLSTTNDTTVSIGPDRTSFSITGNAGTDVITATGHNFVTNQAVSFPTLTGGTNLNVFTRYFVRDVVAGTSFKVSTTIGGGAVDFTTNITAGTVISAASLVLTQGSQYGLESIATAAPTNTAAGGNRRGNGAVDLQMYRNAAADVASGEGALLGPGYAGRASGAYSAAIACYDTQSTGNYSFAAQRSSVASSQYATAIGYLNIAQTSDVAAAIGGQQNISSGARSGIFGGQQNQANASYSGTLAGIQALANRYGMHAHSAGQFSAVGDAQRARFVMRNKTTTNSAVELFLDGSATRLTIPSGKYLTGTINIAGIKSDGTAAASYIRQFSIKNVAGTTSLVGTVNTIGTDEAASTSISITANDTNDALKVEVTGIASETWRWVAAVDVVEVAYGA
jgi:hypothetical protein